MRHSSPPPPGGSNPSPYPTHAVAAADAPAVAAAALAVVTSIVPAPPAPAPHRYATRVGPIPPSPPHPRPTRRAPPSKRARTSSLGESSSSRPQEPYSPPNQGPAGDPPLDLSPASIIRRPYFHCDPIVGNSDCSTRDLHSEVYYDLPAFAADPELIDSMRLVQRYFLEPFMTPRQFFYPRVVKEFYHTMISRREPNPTAIHFTINGRPGILRATNCSYVQSAGGPRQLDRLKTVAPSLYQGDGSFIIPGHDNRVYLVQDGASLEYAPCRSHSAV